MSKKLSYEEAYEELQGIVNSIENEEVSVDALAKNVERASELIKICSDKLRNTETAVDKIIREMSEQGPSSDESKTDLPF